MGNFTGLFKKSQSKHNLFYLHRTNPTGTFEAIFSATLSVDGQTAIGTLVNTSGMHGTMLMVRREALSRFKHLVQPETARQTELAETQPPSEVSVDDIPRGVKALEASLNEERMTQAVEMFEKLDKNKDGKITVPEVPAKQFENKVWVQANLNGDMILTWEEELIWQYNFQKKKAMKSKTEALVTETPKNNEGIPQGVKALEASLNEERMAQAVEMFEKLDKNKDGKITVPEVPVKQFENKVWVQANLNGDMILTWEEELIWQYNFQKKKAMKSKTEALVTETPKNNEGIPQGVKALEASLNEERMAQAVEMFEKLDKNKDGKITVPEVPEKQFKNKAWIQQPTGQSTAT